MTTIQVYKDNSKTYRWRLIASNGRIVADSAEGYSTRAHAVRAVHKFMELAPEAEITGGTVEVEEVVEGE